MSWNPGSFGPGRFGGLRARRAGRPQKPTDRHAHIVRAAALIGNLDQPFDRVFGIERRRDLPNGCMSALGAARVPAGVTGKELPVGPATLRRGAD